jgi:NTP pyrophosphatase (non-canonical NTP hydrolase)
MNPATMQRKAWKLASCACKASKLLLWLRDVDSPQRLAPKLRQPLEEALHTVIRLPDALGALRAKMCDIYRVALRKRLVGIGASPFSGRLGERTAEFGLLAAFDFARDHRKQFVNDATTVCSRRKPDWKEIFALAEKFIKYLDWGEFVLENSRGQASCLVLECVELLDAVSKGNQRRISEEIGDVFYNFVAFCLSVRIQAKHVS